ncbi:cytochrome P450 [Pueribacillus theae]|uniref:Cytochrome P450 n=1 Tax=Pueribacillus theae TaxID=2171751 RepID=A0A2U1JY80_9BACI|nr:cytochrome P450 [Pueribacillus theae]PWA09733.1 cytochrome P450 [Pueribacillus theae]
MTDYSEMPEETGIDHSLSLLREGYLFIPNRRHSFHSDVFETKLLGKRAICMGGKDAAEIFYDNEKFKRHGAAPNRVKETLFGEKGVQTLDGEAHRHRKAMFMSLMLPERLDELADMLKKQWEVAVNKWKEMDEVVFYEETKKLLCITACQWAGVPLSGDELEQRTEELSSLFESPAAVGPKHWKGRHGRNAAEKWVGELIEQVREGELKAPEGMALHTIASHLDLEGNLLDPKIAAVEVINILRPIIAISIYINFLALALYHYPEEKEKIKSKGETYAEMFIQEVRRFYPFFPAAVALVKKDFTWKGYEFKEGTLTLLDLYGTNHDPEPWDNPDVFHPERFAHWDGDLYNFIPQGGGDYYTGHRCAGEWATIQVMKVSLDFLVNRMDYEVPDQDLSFSMVNMPSIPKSKIVIKNVKPK